MGQRDLLESESQLQSVRPVRPAQRAAKDTAAAARCKKQEEALTINAKSATISLPGRMSKPPQAQRARSCGMIGLAGTAAAKAP